MYPKKVYAEIDDELFEATAENEAEEFNLKRSGYLPKEIEEEDKPRRGRPPKVEEE